MAPIDSLLIELEDAVFLFQNFRFEPPIAIKIGRRVATEMFFSNDHHGSSETIIGFNTKTSSR